MPSITEITVSQLSRLIGLPHVPTIVDVRGDAEFAADPRLIPGSQRRDFSTVASWGPDFKDQSVIVVCQEGLQLSQGVGAWMRARLSVASESLLNGAGSPGDFHWAKPYVCLAADPCLWVPAALAPLLIHRILGGLAYDKYRRKY